MFPDLLSGEQVSATECFCHHRTTRRCLPHHDGLSPFNLWTKKPLLLARYLITMVSKHRTAKLMLPLSHNIHHRVSPWAANYRESHMVGQNESVKLRLFVQPATLMARCSLWGETASGNWLGCEGLNGVITSSVLLAQYCSFWKPQLVHTMGAFHAVLDPVKVLWVPP